MTTLWPGLILLSVLAMLFVLVPLWRYRALNTASTLAQRRAKNLEVFRQRELELEQDLQQGLTLPDEHARLVAELQRAFMADMQALDGQATGKSAWTGGKPLLLVLVLLIPVTSLTLYFERGAGRDLALPDLLQRLGAADSAEAQTATLTELAAFLQQRFARNPADIQNGYMLGTLYMELDRYPDAVATFEQLLMGMEANADRATVLGQLAQARYMLDDSQLTPAVQAIIDETLALNPNEGAVMSILAIDAFLQEDFAGAVSYWRRQLAAATPGSPQAEMLRQRIATVEEYLPDTAEPAAVESSGQITVTIDIAPELADRAEEYARLFVYVSNPAMPRPILAKNQAVPEFPFTITLDDSDAMMPGDTAASAPELVVGARLSREGIANARAGDLQTLSAPFVLSELNAPVELLIDEIAP
jgi:cytochrome c-type biogenesis protein CcmH